MERDLDYDDDRAQISRLNTGTRGRRAESELQGIVRLIRFDRKISDDEIAALAGFLASNSEFATEWPFARIWSVLNRILEDGIVTDDERRELFDVLGALDSSVRGPTDGLFDDDVEIVIENRSFAITGVLQLGKRKELQARLAAVGGLIHDSVKMTTDYLVAGDLGSDDWITSRYGTKFKKVLDNRKRGIGSTKIVREVFTVEALTAAELRKARGI